MRSIVAEQGDATRIRIICEDLLNVMYWFQKSNAPVPEPMGVICAAVYLIVMFLFIPFPFIEWIGTEWASQNQSYLFAVRVFGLVSSPTRPVFSPWPVPTITLTGTPLQRMFQFLETTCCISRTAFPYTKFLAFLSGLISVCTAILLGFADDVLDLRWRHKLAFPTLSSLPILMVYYVSGQFAPLPNLWQKTTCLIRSFRGVALV